MRQYTVAIAVREQGEHAILDLNVQLAVVVFINYRHRHRCIVLVGRTRLEIARIVQVVGVRFVLPDFATIQPAILAVEEGVQVRPGVQVMRGVGLAGLAIMSISLRSRKNKTPSHDGVYFFYIRFAEMLRRFDSDFSRFHRCGNIFCVNVVAIVEIRQSSGVAVHFDFGRVHYIQRNVIAAAVRRNRHG